MKKLLTRTALITVMAFSLSGCVGEMVEVPPASVGMILGPNGYQGDIIPPSRFRLPFCMINCDKLVVIEAGDVGMLEAMEVLMPEDQLMLGVDVRFTLALGSEREQILTVFDRVVPTRLQSGNFGTNIEQVYRVYGESIVRNVVRATLSEFTIAEVASNQAEVSELLRRNVAEALSRTPLEIRQFGLADIRYPDVIRIAMEATQERRIAVERAEAEAQVQIREAQARLEVTRAEREADLLAAQTMAESNRILAEGVTPEVIRYMELQVLREMAQNENAVFFPVEMLGDPAMMNRMTMGPNQ